MLTFFKWFKRKPTYRDFIVDLTHSSKKPICYGELFSILGINDLIRPFCKDGKYHYANLRANYTTILWLNNILATNLVKTKNKYSQIYKDAILYSISNFDSLFHAPKTDNTIKDYRIRVLLPTHKEYKPPLEK